MLAVRSNSTSKAHFIGDWNKAAGTFVQKKCFDPESGQNPCSPHQAGKSGLPPPIATTGQPKKHGSGITS
jgi:hypothetical protein